MCGLREKAGKHSQELGLILRIPDGFNRKMCVRAAKMVHCIQALAASADGPTLWKERKCV